MPIEMCRAYLDTIRERYKNAPKKQKTAILSEFVINCGYSRKYAIRILNGRLQLRITKSGPKPIYSQVEPHLVALWERMGRMCSKKMKAALPLWIQYYPHADEPTQRLILAISPSSIDRLLKSHRSRPKGKGLTSTRPSLFRHTIPIKLLDSEVKHPGYIEADTVAHCGNRIEGAYAHRLTLTDLLSGWTENRATWTKDSEGVTNRIAQIEKELPFPTLGFACDNGTEFLNERLYFHLTKRDNPVDFVRRRPYRKNDSAHVEQKNGTHVRELFGYERSDHSELVPLMNEIYSQYWNPLWNYFTPFMKLKSKERVGSKYIKKYDEPKTPYQRLLESSHLSQDRKDKVKQRVGQLNPFKLKEGLDSKLKTFFDDGVCFVQNAKPKLSVSRKDWRTLTKKEWDYFFPLITSPTRKKVPGWMHAAYSGTVLRPSVSRATFAAIFNGVPIFFPFFTPSEGALAYGTDFLRKVFFFHPADERIRPHSAKTSAAGSDFFMGSRTLMCIAIAPTISTATTPAG